MSRRVRADRNSTVIQITTYYKLAQLKNISEHNTSNLEADGLKQQKTPSRSSPINKRGESEATASRLTEHHLVFLQNFGIKRLFFFLNQLHNTGSKKYFWYIDTALTERTEINRRRENDERVQRSIQAFHN